MKKSVLTPEEIKEGNFLIAKFKKYKYSDDTKTFFQIPEHKYKDERYGSCYDFYPEEMKFHLSWDWLMPIVDKIERVKDNGYKYMFSLTTFSVRFLYRGNRVIDLPINTNKLEATYRAVIKFIKIYNASKKAKS